MVEGMVEAEKDGQKDGWRMVEEIFRPSYQPNPNPMKTNSTSANRLFLKAYPRVKTPQSHQNGLQGEYGPL